MTTIYLYGEMAQRFGRKWKMDVASPAEAIRAIEANRPGLAAYLIAAGDRGVKFKVSVDGSRATTEDHLKIRRESKVIRISPVVAGNKDGLGQLFAGILLVAISVFVPPVGILGAKIGAMTVAGYIGAIGVSMAVGGVATLIAGVPKLDNYAERPDKPSYLFSGPANIIASGDCVPLVYGGPIHAPLRIISAGIYSEDEVRPADDQLSDGPFASAGEYDDYTGLTPPSTPVSRDLQTRQYMRILGLISEGEIAGLCAQDGTILSDADRDKGIYLEETPIRNNDGTFAFKRVKTAFRPGTAAQTYIPGFPSAEAETGVNQKVSNGGNQWTNSVQRQIPAGAHNAVRVNLRVPALYKIDSKGNRTGTTVRFGIQIKRSAVRSFVVLVVSLLLL